MLGTNLLSVGMDALGLLSCRNFARSWWTGYFVRYSNPVLFSGVDYITVAVINICLLPYFNANMANCVHLCETTSWLCLQNLRPGSPKQNSSTSPEHHVS